MRSWRRGQPQGPSTASRLFPTALRILIRVRKKKVVNAVTTIHICEEGQILAPQPWKRYQNTPVTWNGPSSRRTQPPVSGACGGFSGATGPAGAGGAGGRRARLPRAALALDASLIGSSAAPPRRPPRPPPPPARAPPTR